MWNPIKNLFAKAAAPGKGAPAQTLVPLTTGNVMPTVMTPKVATKQATLPSYVPSAQFIAAPLLRKDINAANTDIASTSRLGTTTQDVIRSLGRLNPDLSAAISAFLRVGIPEKYVAVGRNMDGTFNREATQLAGTILRQIDLMPDYASGFSQVSSLRSLCEALGKEIMIEGACAMELVLDKNRMPYKLQPVSVKQIVFREDGDVQSIFPQQLISGQYIDLDQPTFFYTSLDQDLLTAYAISPLEAAVQPVLAASGFLQDMRRICQRHVFPRYDIEIDEEKLRARMPPEVLNDTDACSNYINNAISAITTIINGMGIEEALIHFDFFTVKFIENDSGKNADSFETVKTIYDEKISTGSRVLPSILGHGAGSQNVASSETMVFMLSANGMIRLKLQEILSKAMTLAVRLFGMDVTIDFQFESINLRPEAELEAFLAMRQSRTLEQLSLGFLTDDEAALALTGQLTPVGFKPLSGTGFHSGAGVAPGSDISANPLGNKQGALQQTLKPETPTKKKS